MTRSAPPPPTRRESRSQLPDSLLRRYRELTRARIERCLQGRDLPIYDMMRYHLGLADRRGEPVGDVRRGKMLRPVLCLLCCETVGGDAARAAPAAAALELLHNFTLIHDDIEDASRSRHGRETVWRLWGEAQAINTGDGMYALAHLALVGFDDEGVAAEAARRAARILDGACLELCEGQHMDLSFETRESVSRDEYMRMVEGKSAALFGAAASLGALLGGASDEAVAAFDRFGRRLGLAFQVQDDLAGTWGDARRTGKPAEDILARKKSYPVVYALENASPADREWLRRAYASPGAPIDTAAVAAALERSGAIRESQEQSGRSLSEAMACLEGLSLVASRRRALEALAALIAGDSR